jgi:hypothetical protein
MYTCYIYIQQDCRRGVDLQYSSLAEGVTANCKVQGVSVRLHLQQAVRTGLVSGVTVSVSVKQCLHNSQDAREPIAPGLMQT